MTTIKFFRNFLRNRNSLAYKLFLYIGMNQNGELFYQHQLKEHFKIPLTTINHHITKFKREGLIKHHLELSVDGQKLFKYLWDNARIKKLRAHNIQIKFKLTQCPKDYVRKYSRSIFQIVGNNRYTALKGSFQGFIFMFYSPEKIVCTLKDIFGDTDEEISSAVQIIVPKIQEKLEYEFPGIGINDFELARIQTSHIAILDSILAKSFVLRGFTYESKKIAIDESHGRPELEATDPETNLNDIIKLLRLERRVTKKK